MANKAFANKLKKLRQAAGLTQKQVYDFLEIPQSTFSSWEIGKSEPSADTLLRLCKLYKIDNILLAFGYKGLDKSGLVSPNYPELQLIEKYRALDKHGIESVSWTLNHEYSRCTAPKLELVRKEYSLKNVIPLPYSDQPASAGRGTYLGPEAFTTIMVEKNDMTKDALFCIPVSGDSMEPTYHDGDILVVERADELRKGEIGIFTLDGDGYVKECGDGELISLNEEYEPIPMNDTILLNGRVTGVLDPEWIVG